MVAPTLEPERLSSFGMPMQRAMLRRRFILPDITSLGVVCTEHGVGMIVVVMILPKQVSPTSPLFQRMLLLCCARRPLEGVLGSPPNWTNLDRLYIQVTGLERQALSSDPLRRSMLTENNDSIATGLSRSRSGTEIEATGVYVFRCELKGSGLLPPESPRTSFF